MNDVNKVALDQQMKAIVPECVSNHSIFEALEIAIRADHPYLIHHDRFEKEESVLLERRLIHRF